MSKHSRRRDVTGDEIDAFGANGGYRRFYTYLQRPGVVKAIKRKVNRRERREGRAEAFDQLFDVFDDEDDD